MVYGPKYIRPPDKLSHKHMVMLQLTGSRMFRYDIRPIQMIGSRRTGWFCPHWWMVRPTSQKYRGAMSDVFGPREIRNLRTDDSNHSLWSQHIYTCKPISYLFRFPTEIGQMNAYHFMNKYYFLIASNSFCVSKENIHIKIVSRNYESSMYFTTYLLISQRISMSNLLNQYTYAIS